MGLGNNNCNDDNCIGNRFHSYLIKCIRQQLNNANYPSYDQKRDILYNNAVRFFRLDESKLK